MFWQPVIDAERSYLDLVGSRLLELQQHSQRTGNEDLKSIYAGGKLAHDKATEALKALEKDTQELAQHGNAGQLPSRLQALVQSASPTRNKAICHAMSTFRCLKPRPSDVFRAELRHQGRAFMSRMQGLLLDTTIPDAELSGYIEGIGELLCGIELIDTAAIETSESKKKSWVPGILKAGAIAIGTWKIRDLWDGRSSKKHK